MSRKLTQSLLCTPTYTTLARDWLPYWTASVRYQRLTFSHLNLSPSTYHQRSRIHVDRLIYNACHGPSVTDASNPKNNYIKNNRLQCLCFMYSKKSFKYSRNVCCSAHNTAKPTLRDTCLFSYIKCGTKRGHKYLKHKIRQRKGKKTPSETLYKYKYSMS